MSDLFAHATVDPTPTVDVPPRCSSPPSPYGGIPAHEVRAVREAVLARDSCTLCENWNKKVLFVGRSRTGKTTCFEVLRGPTAQPTPTSIFSNPAGPVFRHFSILDKRADTGEEQNYTVDIIDTPGLFELVPKGRETTKRGEQELMDLIATLLELEVTHLHCIFFFVAAEAGIVDADILSLQLLLGWFGNSKIQLGLVLTHADQHGPEWQERMAKQIVKVQGFSEPICEGTMKLLFMGAVDSDSFGHDGSLQRAYSRVGRWRRIMLEFIFGCSNRVFLKDMPFVNSRHARLQELVDQIDHILASFLNPAMAPGGSYQSGQAQAAASTVRDLLWELEKNRGFALTLGYTPRIEAIRKKQDTISRSPGVPVALRGLMKYWSAQQRNERDWAEDRMAEEAAAERNASATLEEAAWIAKAHRMLAADLEEDDGFRLDAVRVKEIRDEITDADPYALTEVESRKVLFIGRTRSGKTTCYNVLRSPVGAPTPTSIFSDLSGAKYHHFSVQNSEGEQQKYTIDIIDTPGLFETVPMGQETIARGETELLDVIEEILKREITHLHCVFMFATAIGGIVDQDRKAMNLLMDLFRGSNVKMGLVFTKADFMSRKDRQVIREEIMLMPGFSDLIQEGKMDILFMGAIHPERFESSEGLDRAYANVARWRMQMLNLIFATNGRVFLRDMPFVQRRGELLKQELVQLGYVLDAFLDPAHCPRGGFESQEANSVASKGKDLLIHLELNQGYLEKLGETPRLEEIRAKQEAVQLAADVPAEIKNKLKRVSAAEVLHNRALVRELEEVGGLMDAFARTRDPRQQEEYSTKGHDLLSHLIANRKHMIGVPRCLRKLEQIKLKQEFIRVNVPDAGNEAMKLMKGFLLRPIEIEVEAMGPIIMDDQVLFADRNLEDDLSAADDAPLIRGQ